MLPRCNTPYLAPQAPLIIPARGPSFYNGDAKRSPVLQTWQREEQEEENAQEGEMQEEGKKERRNARAARTEYLLTCGAPALSLAIYAPRHR